jgi:hypothetical protein
MSVSRRSPAVSVSTLLDRLVGPADLVDGREVLDALMDAFRRL